MSGLLLCSRQKRNTLVRRGLLGFFGRDKRTQWKRTMEQRYGVLLFLACAIATAGGQCTFPSALQATWMTDSATDITIGSSTLEDYPVGVYGSFNFDCNQMYDSRYLLKSQTTLTVSGLTVSIYVCFDFTAVSSNLYYYNLASNETDLQAVFRAQWTIPTAAEVCAQSPSEYDPALFRVMVKNGDGAAAKQNCPTDLVSTWNYELNSGSGNTCNPGGELDACTASQLSVNYTACSTRAFYSNAGLVYCLVSITSGSQTYLSVYNTDTTVDSTNTYRLACLVFETSGSTVSMTQYPDACEAGQTATSVSSPTGSLFTLTNATACSVEAASESNLLTIVLAVIGALLMLCIAGILLFVFCSWKAKQKPFRGKLEPEGIPEEKIARLQAFENGFKRIKHPGELDKPLDRDGSPDHDEDTPINVMQLLRKDVITPGGRESPASHVILSVSTPNPYSFHDGDSVGGGSLPIPHENPALKKHYHVIGGEPSVGGVEEEDEDNLGAEPDGETNTTKTPARTGSGRRVGSAGRLGSGGRIGSGRRAGSARSSHTPVMVMPVRSDGSDAFGDDDGDGDDVSDDALFEADEESTLAAARQGVGINGLGMVPPPRLPPIDEGPASHRSFTGAGNKKSGRRRAFAVARRSAAKMGGEENLSFAEAKEEMAAPATDMGDAGKSPAADASGTSLSSSEERVASSGEDGRFQMARHLIVEMPDVVEHVDMGTGTVEENAGERWAYDATGRTSEQAADGLKPSTLSARGDRDRHGSVLTAASFTSADSRRRTHGKSRSTRKKLKYAADEEFRPKSRVKVTRVDIPELLPPGEVEVPPPGENELVESPGLSFRNVAYQFDLDEVVTTGGSAETGGAGGQQAPKDGATSRSRRWLKPSTGTQDVWSQVSHMWRRAQKLGSSQEKQQPAVSSVPSPDANNPPTSGV